MSLDKSLQSLIPRIFQFRWVILAFSLLCTIFLSTYLLQLETNINLQRELPTKHPFMQTNLQFAKQFGSGNRLIVAVNSKKGTIFYPEYFRQLETITKEVSLLPGIDPATVYSLTTSNIRFIEIIEDGFAGGKVFPDNYTPTPEMVQQVKANIFKSDQALRLVADDFSASLITVEIINIAAVEREQLDFVDIAASLEEKIRQQFNNEDIAIQIVGFAQLNGDIAGIMDKVFLFFAISGMLICIIQLIFFRNLLLAFIPLFTTSVTLICLLGMLPMLNIALHPFAMIVPFLIFAIGTSHAMQMTNTWRYEISNGANNEAAAKTILSRLLFPGLIALCSDAVGFITITHIDVPVIIDMATVASLGVALLILSNIILLPLLFSLVPQKFTKNIKPGNTSKRSNMLWHFVVKAINPTSAKNILILAVILFSFALWKGNQVAIGDLQTGVPELRETARYNIELQDIVTKFKRGIDILVIYAESSKDACVDYSVMQTIDKFSWSMRHTPGVLSVNALPQAAKMVNVGWHEGNLKWFELPTETVALGETVSPIETTSRLLNHDCSILPIYVFAKDHKFETIDTIVGKARQLATKLQSDKIRFRLAGGSLAIHGATNDVVKDAQLSILISVYASIIILTFILFRTVKATICVVFPLVLVSALCYSIMALFDIGLKISTLPVIALGAGIGVDYAIYLFYAYLQHQDDTPDKLHNFEDVLASTGKTVVFTALTLAASVFIWIFSPLKYQADMGLLLTFMFIVNMLAAVVVTPALASFLRVKA